MNPYRVRAERLGAPYEPGIGRLSVLNQAKWQCEMTECRLPNRGIDRKLKRPHQGVMPDGYGTVDHKVPLAVPGTPGHVWSNVRAAHCLCNREDENAVALRIPKKAN